MFAKPVADKIYNLILSWIIISALFFINSRRGFVDLQADRYAALVILVAIAAVILIWLLINMIESQRNIRLFMIGFSTVYAAAAVALDSDELLALGLCAVMGIIILITDTKDIQPEIGKKSFRNTALVLSLLFIAVVSCNSSLIIINHWAPNFDFGIFSQMFHYMKETGIPFTTCERDMLLSHFAVHMSPIYYVLLPFYCLFPSPVTLETLQAIVVVSGVIPLIMIMKRHSLGRGSMMLFTLMYVLFPGFAGGCFDHLHENCFLAPLVLWLIYFSEKELWYGQAIFAILTFAVKEDAAIYVAAISLFFLFTRKNRLVNLIIFVVSVLYFACITHYLTVNGDGVQMWRYGDLLINGDGPLSILVTVITNPIYVLKQIFVAGKLKFIFMTLLPMGFLPLITKDFRRPILMIPLLLVNLLPSIEYQYSMHYHYCFGSCAMLIYMAIINYADLPQAHRKKLLIYGACCSIIMCSCVNYGDFKYFKFFNSSTETREEIDYAVSQVPKDASVAAGTYFVADFADHETVYDLDSTENEADYYVLDLRFDEDDYDVNDFLNDNYGVIYYNPDVVGVFKNLRK